MELFGLKDNFTKDELKQAFIKKVSRIDKLDIDPVEKQLLLREYHKYYNVGKQYLLHKKNYYSGNPYSGNPYSGNPYSDNPYSTLQQTIFNPIEFFNNISLRQNNLLRQFDNLILEDSDLINSPNLTNSFGSSYSMKSILNPDGSRTIIETTNKLTNGKSDKKINSYKIDNKGNKTPIHLSQAKKFIENK